MALRTDVTINWTASPRAATVASPSTTITIQDLNDTLRFLESQIREISQPFILNAGGKQSLGGVKAVGITATLQNMQVAFEARSGPTTVQCTVTDGNLVAVDVNGAAINPILPTAFTQIVVEQSTSPGLITGLGDRPKKNTALVQFHYVLRDSSTHLPKSGVTGITGQIAQDGGAFVALTNSSVEVSNGVYRVSGGFTAGEMNADVVTLRFSAAGVDDTILTIVTAS